MLAAVVGGAGIGTVCSIYAKQNQVNKYVSCGRQRSTPTPTPNLPTNNLNIYATCCLPVGHRVLR
jgi:hypothetical protein